MRMNVKNLQWILINFSGSIMSKEEFPSFDKLLNSNWDYVYNYLLKKTSNKYISEEITIQSFSKAFEKIKTYNPKYNFKTWLISHRKKYLFWLLKEEEVAV